MSYSPAYMYSSYEATQRHPGPYRSYKPRGLGQFDPSCDVHSVTRPNTGASNLVTFQPPPPLTTPDPAPALTAPQFPGRPRPLRIYPGAGDHGDPGTWDDGASVASVFDCHHGCFTPDPSEVSMEERLQERMQEGVEERMGERVEERAASASVRRASSHETSHTHTAAVVTPGHETRSLRSQRSVHGLGASSSSLVPVNVPIDITYGEGEDGAEEAGEYTEMYHSSMGHLFTVKTRDMEL